MQPATRRPDRQHLQRRRGGGARIPFPGELGGSGTGIGHRPSPDRPAADPGGTGRAPTAEPSRAVASVPASVPAAATRPPGTGAGSPTVHPAPAPVATSPGRIVIPTLGVDAAVVPVGVEEDGQMEIPQDVATVGWYRFGPAPGAAAGSAVLTGHVDDVDRGRGVRRSGGLEPGRSDHRRRRHRRRPAVHGPVPGAVVQGRGARWTGCSIEEAMPRLVLITCGGSFDSSTLGYDDNIAVTAVPSAA